MQLCVDYRERGLIELLPGCVVKNLVLGDITIERDGKDLVIIERKTISDFAASISDGRYRDQSARLLEYDIPTHNVVYLLEGSLSPYRQSIPKSTLLASLTSLMLGKGFSVMRTTSLAETAEFVQAMFAKLQKEDGYAGGRKEGASEIRKKKRDSITVETIDGLMLSQIPTISGATASAILAKFPSMFELITALKEDPACLDTITYGTKARKLSKTSIENIRRYLKI